MRKKKLFSKVPYKKNTSATVNQNILKASQLLISMNPSEVYTALADQIHPEGSGRKAGCQLVVCHSDANEMLVKMHDALAQKTEEALHGYLIHWVRKANKLQPTPILTPLLKPQAAGHAQNEPDINTNTLLLMFSEKFDYLDFILLKEELQAMFFNAVRIIVFAPYISSAVRDTLLQNQSKDIVHKIRFAYLADGKTKSSDTERALKAFSPKQDVGAPAYLKEMFLEGRKWNAAPI